MVTAKTLCDCGKVYIGRSHKEREAVTIASRKRALCRSGSPEYHAELRREKAELNRPFIGQPDETV